MHNKHLSTAEVSKKHQFFSTTLLSVNVYEKDNYQYQKRKDGTSKVKKQPEHPHNVQLLIFIQACLIETFQYTTFT